VNRCVRRNVAIRAACSCVARSRCAGLDAAELALTLVDIVVFWKLALVIHFAAHANALGHIVLTRLALSLLHTCFALLCVVALVRAHAAKLPSNALDAASVALLCCALLHTPLAARTSMLAHGIVTVDGELRGATDARVTALLAVVWLFRRDAHSTIVHLLLFAISGALYTLVLVFTITALLSSRELATLAASGLLLALTALFALSWLLALVRRLACALGGRAPTCTPAFLRGNRYATLVNAILNASLANFRVDDEMQTSVQVGKKKKVLRIFG